ncbi:DUF2948 family protein [Tranquillimonas alkanivorans]|uniref:DUF2948 domain-containing protein n=1 Tax=Tranquillimonas alkanivorans TaxID=441119 RepID=A0A1I5T4S2_9RHOB|nr:DUF2948 family protein [Tranquillimonas alkanivorans]SFP78005.1 Protein of unknown function [Tranquillimonas alkanivorans]
MSRDATFEEGGEQPLRLMALEPEDLPPVSALVQDAVFPITEMTWQRDSRRFALLLNRFRWEDAAAAERLKRPFERVRSVLAIENVVRVQSQSVDAADRDQVLSLLSLTWEPGEAPGGRLILTLAGDGAIAVEVEALEVVLKDVTRPYAAPSGRAPRHV